MQPDAATLELRDGTRVHVRAPCPADRGALLEFLRGLTAESRRLRFFSAAANLDEAARWAADADGVDRIGLLALDRDERIVGHAACARLYGPRGEVAVEVDERHRHLGLASRLLGRLAQEAERQGIRSLVAEVLPDNRDMLSVFADEFGAREQPVDGEVAVSFPSAAWRTAPARRSAGL